MPNKNKIVSSSSRLRAGFRKARCLQIVLVAVCLLIGATHATGEAATKRAKIEGIGNWDITKVTQWAKENLTKKYADKIEELNDKVIDGKRLVRLFGPGKDFKKLGFKDDKMKDDNGKTVKGGPKTQAFAYDLIRNLPQAEWGVENTKTRQEVTAWAEKNFGPKLPTFAKRIEKYNNEAIDGKILTKLTKKDLKDRNITTDEHNAISILDKIKFLKREGAYAKPMACMTKDEITEWAEANLTPKQAQHVKDYNNFALPVFDAKRLLSLSGTTKRTKEELGKKGGCFSKCKSEAEAKGKELKKMGFNVKDNKGKEDMLRQIELLKNGPILPWVGAGRRLAETDTNAMSPSEIVLHRRRLTHGACVSPVLAALMDEIEEAKRNPRSRRR